MQDFYVIKVLFFATFAFLFTFSWTPLLTHFLYKYKLGKNIRNSGTTPLFSKMHLHKTGTPTMGGVLVWGTVLMFAAFFFYLAKFFPIDIFKNLNFLSRSQTLLPLGALVATALVGLLDDWLDVRKKGVFGGGGLNMIHRILIYTVIAGVGAFWFYFKLDWTVLHIPFLGNFEIGWWYIPFFILVIVGTAFSVNEIDGLDGLAGGTLLVSYGAYGVIAFMMGRYDLAVFCGVIIGALIAFLWFNVIPARFYMGDTGAMSLGVTLGIIAMLTNYALLLPIIGFLFVLEAASVIIQLLSKRFRGGKKVFLSAPIHHHFEARGWPEAKIVMRFWIVAGITAAIGIILFLLDHTL
ncbi:phospho-N-acetylmuramoyl-pentapeptide-transferase [Candidatus Falkowbacteria bacterium RIFOXYB2_FULL_34_18]|uniref:Phospho-N-acetylmuramoyl-pentapeptide-transferase n=1 Tax=Candidatus Falkowbacteria bacterium RIFOXYD2_FULL_34_120 TaxID=1798007 RepID=A0A1F5TNE7_9BACT|nr:MAG: phospho-N-acetylmuramoyl-pentapeptide-transferase [Candidatus Falkowbacteria bacterium RIFOXYC12_FULL_34_55]OGF28713.1 MAG: phospho-N-acetylmuramoyl-pentapeptide-transferase [Candidatus Falkowbacteria bacterium RIFOXYB2_FULL_34_18]OGF38078.1 MAG: phospho-N-acetylmuramoyl-pentapeptide-transferase [Candidatus Falkowbacteria bacterium RIFOXYC2_FULL_34_220]OGF38332.1 MAG: phospho-N-acetylmuramoyl-pentapeptide-transferase [Candidatus Falkowbacteria bacterium RIFOXYD12_FULL_34_57]OGF40319.1 M